MTKCGLLNNAAPWRPSDSRNAPIAETSLRSGKVGRNRKTIGDNWVEVALLAFLGLLSLRNGPVNKQDLGLNGQDPSASERETGKSRNGRRRDHLLDDLVTGTISGLVAGVAIAGVTIYMDDQRSEREVRTAERLAVLQIISSTDDLDGVQLSGIDLSRSILSGKSLRSSNFEDANLSNVSASEATFDGSSFDTAILSSITISNSSANNVTFIYSTMRGSQFIDFVGRKSIFAHTDLTESHFTRSDLRETDFRYANLSGSSFNASDLRGADFRWSTWQSIAPYFDQICYDEATIFPDGLTGITPPDCELFDED